MDFRKPLDMVRSPPARGGVGRRSLLKALAFAPIAGACGRTSQRFTKVTGRDSAERAIEGARRFRGLTLNVGWESELQAQDLLRFSAPEWERQTGIRINVVELGVASEQLRRILDRHHAGSSDLDCVSVAPSWLADLVDARALEPIDDYVEHYLPPGDLDDYLPNYRSLGVWEGKRYGFFDDGDAVLLYYRKDLVEDADHQRRFFERFGRPLSVPPQWDLDQLRDVARYFGSLGPQLQGMAPFTRELRWAWFQALLRRAGGRFFDPDDMRAEVASDVAVDTMRGMNDLLKSAPPDTPPRGVLGCYLSGRSALATFWPPLGRWAAGFGLERVRDLPRSQVAGKTGYALLPGGVTQMAWGFVLAVLTRSRHPEAAYLFTQWMSSPEVSLKRVMQPFALRDPYRVSHFDSPEYAALWPSARDYLDTLRRASEVALIDLSIPGTTQYEAAFHQAMVDLRLDGDVSAALRTLAARWDAITGRLGQSRQRRAYRAFLELPGSRVRRTP